VPGRRPWRGALLAKPGSKRGGQLQSSPNRRPGISSSILGGGAERPVARPVARRGASAAAAVAAEHPTSGHAAAAGVWRRARRLFLVCSGAHGRGPLPAKRRRRREHNNKTFNGTRESLPALPCHGWLCLSFAHNQPPVLSIPTASRTRRWRPCSRGPPRLVTGHRPSWRPRATRPPRATRRPRTTRQRPSCATRQ